MGDAPDPGRGGATGGGGGGMGIEDDSSLIRQGGRGGGGGGGGAGVGGAVNEPLATIDSGRQLQEYLLYVSKQGT